VTSNACPRPFAHVPAGRAAGAADTVNGGIDIDANAVVTSAKTVNGRIALGANATADSLATVSGELRFEREVKLYVSDRATVGPITGATAIPFSGDSPPN